MDLHEIWDTCGTPCALASVVTESKYISALSVYGQRCYICDFDQELGIGVSHFDAIFLNKSARQVLLARQISCETTYGTYN